MLLSKIESFSQRNYLINIENDDKFYRKQIAICIFCWLTTFRYILLAITSNRKIWAIIGDPFYYTNDRILLNSLLFGISLLGSLFRLTFIMGKWFVIIILDSYLK